MIMVEYVNFMGDYWNKTICLNEKLHLLEQFPNHLVSTKAECVAFIFSNFLKLEPLEAVLFRGISKGSFVGSIQKVAFKDIYILSMTSYVLFVQFAAALWAIPIFYNGPELRNRKL